ncbi:MAG: Crp/Fnr family transcriptional regulator [Desulfobacterales bacterium]|nr:Crp/Fnr family transcriptional regulator [Desulfobacterales bacterium]MCP4159797.1 Crp/Fnr family transcriptional regulator [Deltaproteobacteria bacterium]
MFAGLPDNQLKALRDIIISKDYSRGETIFSEGDEGNGFYITKSGSVKIFKLSFEGKEQILHIYGAGEPFGEVAVFTGIPFPANAVALKKSTVLFFEGKKFTELLIKDPSLSLNLLGVLSIRLKQFTVQVENLSLKEVPGRLAEHLIWLSNDQKNTKEVTLEISKGQLASLLGTIPETLSRILGKMNTESLIEVHGKKIIILDYENLVNLSKVGRLEDLH